MTSQYLFVYGTLLPELAPLKMADTVGRLKLVGAATVRGRLYDLGDYPGARLEGGGRIHGRVFEIEPVRELLKIFDAYEGFSRKQFAHSEFVRKKCRAVLGDGSRIGCWIYEYNRQPGSAKMIASGDYLVFKNRTAARTHY